MSNEVSVINIDLINVKGAIFSNSKGLSDVELYLMEQCLLETNSNLLSLCEGNVEELLNSDCLNFLDLEILDSSISEEECDCSESNDYSFDNGYGNYLPVFNTNNIKYCFVVNSLDLLLSYEVLGIKVNIKCLIEFEETDSNHFLESHEVDFYIDNFIDCFLVN